MDLLDFKETFGGRYIRPKNEMDAVEFLVMLHTFGFKWDTGFSLVETPTLYNNESCYYVNINNNTITHYNIQDLKNVSFMIYNNFDKLNIKQRFDSKFKRKIVHCSTMQLAYMFLKMADKAGYKWFMGENLLKELNWNKYKYRTVYFVGDTNNKYKDIITYGDSEGLSIISLLESLNDWKAVEFKKEDYDIKIVGKEGIL